jgi:hypothetical protein
MWNNIHTFLSTEYSGYAVDIASLMPTTPTLVTTGTTFADAGQVSIGMVTPLTKARLYSTLLHEIKHAIDQNSHAAVEGAAWEGAALTVEEQVFPNFLDRFMPGEAALGRLQRNIDLIGTAGTTEATLKLFLRDGCPDDQPDTIEYAKEIISNYYETTADQLTRGSWRVHYTTQFLQYEYGSVNYVDLLSYLQAGVGATPRVDAYLLQACGMPSPKKEQASINRLQACIAARR